MAIKIKYDFKEINFLFDSLDFYRSCSITHTQREREKERETAVNISLYSFAFLPSCVTWRHYVSQIQANIGKYAEVQCVLISCLRLFPFLLLFLSYSSQILKLSAGDRTVKKKGYSQLYNALGGVSIIKNDNLNSPFSCLEHYNPIKRRRFFVDSRVRIFFLINYEKFSNIFKLAVSRFCLLLLVQVLLSGQQTDFFFFLINCNIISMVLICTWCPKAKWIKNKNRERNFILHWNWNHPNLECVPNSMRAHTCK